jgi:hypothetical protein
MGKDTVTLKLNARALRLDDPAICQSFRLLREAMDLYDRLAALPYRGRLSYIRLRAMQRVLRRMYKAYSKTAIDGL